jgi:hypothetical protein
MYRIDGRKHETNYISNVYSYTSSGGQRRYSCGAARVALSGAGGGDAWRGLGRRVAGGGVARGGAGGGAEDDERKATLTA